MNETAINWTDKTWNPASGCTEVSEGCRFCYAKTLAEQKRGTRAFPHGFDLTIRPHKLREPIALQQPSLVFVNSMSDLFWEAIDDDYRDRVFEVIAATPRHQFQILTKRPEIMAQYTARRPLPANVWAGVTIESDRVTPRADVLRGVNATIRFISAEPLLSALPSLRLEGIHWLIAGGESGIHLRTPHTRERRGLVNYSPGAGGWSARPDRIDWVRGLRDACAEHSVAFWMKQWGGVRPHSAGRLLDGRTWDELPRHWDVAAGRWVDR